MSGKRARAAEATKDPTANWSVEKSADQEKRLADLPPGALDIPPPTPEQWHNFLKTLAYAGAIAADGDHLHASVLGVKAAVDLVEAGARPELDKKLTTPLWLLLTAMGNVGYGRLPDMFNPKRKMDGQPRASIELTAIRELATLAVEEFIAAGEKPAEAYSIVARALPNPAEIKTRGNAPLHKAVKGWREDQMRQDRRADYNGRLARWRSEFASTAGREGTPGERAKILISALRSSKF